MQPQVETFFDEDTNTFSYVVVDPATRKAAIVDPVLGYDAASGRTDPQGAEALINAVRAAGAEVSWILETHAHADHLSAAPFIKAQLGGQIAIGEGIRFVQAHFRDVFNLEPSFIPDGRQFDHLFADGESFTLGSISATALHTPGHTNDSMSYVIGDAAFIGDTLFTPEYGTARCDFPGGDARLLHRSIQRLFALPAATRLFLCHDYPEPGSPPRSQTTIAEQREANIHVGGGRDEDAFVRMREARDRTLSLPKLILPSIQVNIRAGELPPVEDNGQRYLKIPLNGV